MPGVSVVVKFSHRSGLPRDSIINTFHFAGIPASQADRDAIFTAIQRFYNLLSGAQTASVASYLSDAIDRAVPVQRIMYDTSGLLSGPPIDDADLLLAPAANNEELPSEVAAVASFYSGAASNVATGRGRIYLGPLTQGVVAIGPNQYPELDNGFRTNVVEAMKELEDATPANPWAVRLVQGGSVVFHDVDGGFVDSAFDTQRRRGEQALTRTSWHV